MRTDDADVLKVVSGIAQFRSGNGLRQGQAAGGNGNGPSFFDRAENKDQPVFVVGDEDGVARSEPDVVALIAFGQKIVDVHRHGFFVPDETGAGQIGVGVMAVAQRDTLQKVHRPVHVKRAGVPELPEQVKRMALVLSDFDDHPGIVEVFFSRILDLFLRLGQGHPAHMNRSEIGHLNVAVAVHPASRWRLNIAQLRIG